MEKTTEKRRRIKSLLSVFGLAGVLAMLLWGAVRTAFVAPLSIAGFSDFTYDDPELDINVKLKSPTAEKPESKLWWNDGYWWAVLYNPTTDYYHIYRLNWGDKVWVDTGVQADNRRADPLAIPPQPPQNIRVDTMWDAANQKLYVASHLYADVGSRVNNYRGLLFRYSYDKDLQTYILDVANGFLPTGIQINEHKTETLVLAKDSNGRLWSSFVGKLQGSTDSKVLVTYSNGNGLANDAAWTKAGFMPPFTQSVTVAGDISTIFAFKNNGQASIGVVWTNDVADTLHMAIHPDNVSNPQAGWTYEAIPTPYGIDDHIAVRTNTAGQIFIAAKMHPLNDGDPQIAVIARDVDISKTWTIAGYSTLLNDDTRPTLVIDEGVVADPVDDKLYVFATGREGGSDVCYKYASIDQTTLLSETLSFPTDDCGTPFIMDNGLDRFDNATTTKQNLNSLTGLVGMASDNVNGLWYGHNQLGNPVPVAFPFGPARGGLDVLPTAVVSATFNKPMQPSTINNATFTVEDSLAVKLTGVIVYDAASRTAFFTPSTPLKANETYTVKLTKDVKDTGNVRLGEGIEATNAIVREQWSFKAMSPTISFASVSYSVLENTPQATITLTLSAPSVTPVSVNVGSADGTAVAGDDYTALVPPQTVTFLANEAAKTFTVAILDDLLAESNEDLVLSLSGSVNGGLTLSAIPTATLTIFDNEGPPTVQFSQATFQSDENLSPANVTVSLYPTMTVPVHVNVATVDGLGTASVDTDYTAVPSTTVTFAPGESTKIVPVTLANDTLDENDETVVLTLGGVSAPTAVITPVLGLINETVLTIVDEDATPTVSFSASTFNVAESAGLAAVNVALSAPSGLPVTVTVNTADGLANAGLDYETVNETIVFAPGAASQTVDVPIIDDTLDENDEEFVVTLQNPVNAVEGITNETAVVIEDNDAPVAVNFELAEYDVDEDVGTLDIIIGLTGESSKSVTVDYATSDGTAEDGNDYTGTSGLLTFNPGVLTQTISIDVADDALGEQVETVNLTLSNPGPSADDLVLGDQSTALLSIYDNDLAQVGFITTTYSVDEAAGILNVEIRLSSAASTAVTVDYSIINGTAEAGSDFTAANDTLTFAPNQTVLTIQVPITNDLRDEAAETFQIVLSNPSNATLSQANTATITILDNDEVVFLLFLPVVQK